MAETNNALVTGAALRLGALISEHLSRLGYSVGLHCNRSHSAAGQLSARLPGSSVLTADLSQPEGAQQLWRQYQARAEHCDLLVHNASSFQNIPLLDLSYQQWLADLNLHCWSALELLQQLARQQRPAQAVLILDTRISRNDSSYFSYNLSKRMLADIVRRAAKTLAPQVRVNAIAPGPLLASAADPESFAASCARLPLPGAVPSAALLRALDYLITSASVTGEILFVDGGENLLS